MRHLEEKLTWRRFQPDDNQFPYCFISTFLLLFWEWGYVSKQCREMFGESFNSDPSEDSRWNIEVKFREDAHPRYLISFSNEEDAALFILALDGKPLKDIREI